MSLNEFSSPWTKSTASLSLDWDVSSEKESDGRSGSRSSAFLRNSDDSTLSRRSELSLLPARRRDDESSLHATAEERRQPYDVLTVFQASPLALKSKATGEWENIATLDFRKEREILTKTIKDASSRTGTRIDLDFRVATRDGLGDFLAHEDSQLLHFSCHAGKT